MQIGTMLAFDSSWNHRGRIHKGIVVLIDLLQRNIIDFEVIDDNQPNSVHCFEGSGNGFEAETLKRMREIRGLDK
jgi:hypothetical protein